VNKILEAAQALSDSERQELCRLLEERAVRQLQPRAARQISGERGVIRTIPPRPTPDAIARFRAWKPVKMPGGSLSDELVRDRR